MKAPMIKYVSLYNPDDRIIKEASTMLLNNKLIACPTDTNYSIFVPPLPRKEFNN